MTPQRKRGLIMSDEFQSKPGTVFWVVAGLLAVWNLSGLYMYYGYSTATADFLLDVGYTEAQVAYTLETPAWAHSAFAIAVNAGVLGSIFLILRKAWAVPMFVLSLLGALLQHFDAYVLRGAYELFLPSKPILPVLIIAGCAFGIWYSLHAKKKGWLS